MAGWVTYKAEQKIIDGCRVFAGGITLSDVLFGRGETPGLLPYGAMGFEQFNWAIDKALQG